MTHEHLHAEFGLSIFKRFSTEYMSDGGLEGVNLEP